MPARKRPASRGFVNNIILESLLSGDKYGYEIIKIVEEKSNGKIILKQPSLYSSLKRFETKGFITSYWGDSDIGGKRHYYTITETGKNYYNKNVLKIDADLDDNNFDLDDDFDLTETDSPKQTTIEEQITVLQKQNISEEPVKPHDSNKIEQLKIEVNELPTKTTLDEEPIINFVETKEINNTVDESEFEDDFEDEEIEEESITTNVDDDDYDVFALLERNINSSPTKKKKQIKQEENSIQVDMFSKTETNVSKNEEKIDIESLNSIKSNDSNNTYTTTTQVKKDIPLIEEKAQEYFTWEEYKQTSPSEQVIMETLKDEKPLKNQIVMDEYGIIKVGETIEEKPATKKIFDNVGARIEYYDPVVKPKKQEQYEQQEELTEEQREEKNKQFTQKLDKIINEKTNNEDDIDYKNILGELLAKDEPESTKPEISENNFMEENEIAEEEIERVITNVDRTYHSYSTISNDSDFKFKPYNSNAVEEKENKSNFILINKARFNFGLIASILMILQISVLFIILKCYNLLSGNDYILFAVFYAIAIAFLLLCIIPYFVAPEKRTENTFRFSYTLLFGILLFLASCALTYAGCTFAGLNGQNVSMFAAKILLPIIFFINYIIDPIIYKVVLQDKRLY